MSYARAESVLSQLGREENHFSRLKKLIQWGKQLPPLTEEEKSRAQTIPACQDKTLLYVKIEGSKLHFRAQSESVFVNGLIYLFVRAFDGMEVDEFLKLSPEILKKTGLKQLSLPSRANTAYILFEAIRENVKAKLSDNSE